MRLRTFGGLWIEDPGARSASGAAGRRPRSLALLAILAAHAPTGASRERVLGILWPESDPDRARHALSQTLYSLRRDLGGDVVLASPDLRLDPALVSSDLEAFRAAVEAKDWEAAARHYAGPFLDGFYLNDAPEFERWAEESRAAFGAVGIRAIESHARQRADEGRLEEAVEQWRRLTRLDPFGSRFAALYMEGLAATGHRAAAIAHGKAHAELVRRELEAEPDRAIRTLMQRLRESAPVRWLPERPEQPTEAPTDVPTERSPSPAAASTSPVDSPSPAPPRPRRMRVLLAVAATMLLAGIGWWTASTLRAGDRPVLAVGQLRDLVTPDSVSPGGVLSEMLSISLARVTDLQVVANSRLLELTAPAGAAPRATLGDAARRAGATQIIEGEMSRVGAEGLRLEVRRVDTRSGLVSGAYRIEGRDRIALLDSLTALVAADLRLHAPAGSLADVSTRSPIAYRLYEEGLRAFYQFDASSAARLFRAAIREDSTFAMATYYAWRTATMSADSSQYQLADRAMLLAARAPARDRLLIRAHVGAARSDPSARAAAESLAAAHPRDPEALVRAAEILSELPRSTSLLERAIAIDSATGAAPAAVCRLCDALDRLASTYAWADSTGATERTLRRWMRLRPADAAPWARLGDHLIALGRREEAEQAQRRHLELGGVAGDARLLELTWSLRTDDLAEADARCRDGLASASDDAFGTWRWYCTIALRNEGRLRDALRLNADGRIPGRDPVRRGVSPDPLLGAIIDFESGRPLLAAERHLASATEPVGAASALSPGLRARHAAWRLTLAATALVQA
ncbi:MAG TPA: BTAD domain-containing putative transcriptional regulator, partial [Gemmatimonadaceae bacterium]|nr:BTAD domain-containing putative transcriptional regulator [Gemmatimonadaceae bacterium]